MPVGSGSGAMAAGVCAGGGTIENLVTGLDAVIGGNPLDRTSPANLVANGDFTIEPAGLASSAQPNFYFWGTSGRVTKSSTALNTAVPYWERSGGSPAGTANNAGTYAFWTKQLTGNPNSLSTPMANGQSAGRVYFGNGITTSITPVPSYNPSGFSTGSYTLTPGTGYGTSDDPPTLSQDVPTVSGERYRMYFAQETENFKDFEGIAALDISGYQRLYFRVFKDNHGFMVEFTATSNTTRISFMNWGHLNGTYYQTNTADVTLRQRGSSTVTLTTATAHGYSVGTTIYVSGVGAAYDGQYTISSATSTTFSYPGPAGTSESQTAVSPVGKVSKLPNLSLISTEFVLDDVIINACTAAGQPSADRLPVVTPDAPSTPNAPSTGTVATDPSKPSASPDFTSGPLNKAQKKDLLLNDAPSTGAKWKPSTVRLCASGEKPNKCTVGVGGKVSVPNVGTYTINDSGVITFTPVRDYVGTPKPLKYQLQDTTNQYADSEYTPTIVPPMPKAKPQKKYLLPGDSVDYTSVIASNGLGTGMELQAGKKKGPCFVVVSDGGTTCVTSHVVEGEGKWKIDQSTGVATFTALKTITAGTKTAVTYRITDKWGNTAESTLTPIVKTSAVEVNSEQTEELPQTGRNSMLLISVALLLLLAGFGARFTRRVPH